MNPEIAAIVAEHVQDVEDAEALVRALTAREDEKLDWLRLQAAAQGLFPSITSWVLSQSGLGTALSQEELALLQQQAAREQQQIQQVQEQFRRMFGDGP